MRPHQLPRYDDSTFKFTCMRPGETTVRAGDELRLRTQRGRVIVALIRDGRPQITPWRALGDDEQRLLAWTSLHAHRLVVAEGITGGVLLVRALPLHKVHTEPTLEFCVDERVMNSASRLNAKIRNVDGVIAWLTDQCIVSGLYGALDRALASSGQEVDEGTLNAFTLHGRSTRVMVQVEEDRNGAARLCVMRVVRARSAQSTRYPLWLLEGSALSFVDRTSASIQRRAAFAALSKIHEESGERAYLNIWNRYGDTQAEHTFERARTIGAIGFNDYEPQDDGTVRFILNARDGLTRSVSTLRRGDELTISPPGNEPGWLSAPIEDLTDTRRLGENSDGSCWEFIEAGELSLSLRPRDEQSTPRESGLLHVPLRGDITMLARRAVARRAIAYATTPIPHLGTLLERGQYECTPPMRVDPLSDHVRRKVFGDEYTPTSKQREAIEVALNTPDIALIQGPPGTGKTTVITAIVERLNEIMEAQPGMGGRILISGFQHDAVENALDRLEVNSLPSVKVGGRRGGDRTESELSWLNIERWRDTLCDSIEARLTDHQSQDLHDARQALLHSTGALIGNGVTCEEALAHVDAAYERVFALAPSSSDALTRLDDAREEIGRRLRARRAPAAARELLRSTRALRVSPEGYEDDGALNARRALAAWQLDGELHGEEEASLAHHAHHAPATVDEWRAWRRLRHQLLMRALPNATEQPAVPPLSAVREALVAALDAVDEHARLHASERDKVAVSLASSLRGDDGEVRRTLAHYAIVHGATTQQAAGRAFTTQFREARGNQAQDISIIHDAVLIDEAARANPLDLLIPMTRGKRIILVGDHRQLPHMLDGDVESGTVERVLEESDEAAESDASTQLAEYVREQLQRSLFQTLFDALENQQRNDGIRRTITLDQQFRMHPELGNFVGEHFYAPFNEDYHSPRPAEHFSHNLPAPYAGRCAAWLNVPHDRGGESRDSNNSRLRAAEARRIASELKRLMDHPGGSTLSFGVITFYRGQVNELCRAMAAEGLGEVSDPGDGRLSFEPYEQYARLEDDHERLRVGTVDAFQGKEFDVVFLSMVRSQRRSHRSSLDERALIGMFGFLASPNRLCVALSRQKRLLVMVGDQGMLAQPSAERVVAPLISFYRGLCAEVSHE